MKIKNRILRYFITLFVFIGLQNCNNNSTQVNALTTHSAIDSIQYLINLGRNANNSYKLRKDNLIKVYKKSKSLKNDSIHQINLSRIQWNFLNLKDSSWFRKTNREASQLAIKRQDSVRLAGSLWDLGIFMDDNGIKDSAYVNFYKAQKIYSFLDDKKRAGMLAYDMAHIQECVKNYTSAEVNAIYAIELLKPLDENLMLFKCYNLLGIISKDLAEYGKSLQYYSIAENYLEKVDKKENYLNQLTNNIGVAYLQSGNYSEAITNFSEVLKVDSIRFKYPGLYAKVLNNLAQCQYRIQLSSDAEKNFMISLEIRKSLDNKGDLAGGYFNLAEYYLHEKDTTKALNSAMKSKNYAEQSSNNERLLESLHLLTFLDTENAADYGIHYISLNDSLQIEERKIRNKFARIRFETDEVVAENISLSRERKFLASIAIAILLLGSAGYIIIDQRTKNQTLRFEQEQQNSDEKIFSLMLSEKQKFEEGKKLEQKRISEELHDSVLGKMLGARMVLTGLNKKDDQDSIIERGAAIVALKNVESEIRSISHELNNSAYQEIYNFIRSIRDLLQNMSRSAGINHTFIYDETLDWDDLKGKIKINVYRILQESLQNSIKHSKCENLILNLIVIEDKLCIHLDDDGIGFDFNPKRKGIGIRNIRSRIKKLNGKWHIVSVIGKGTSIRLTVPIEYSSSDSQNFDELNNIEKI